MSKIHIVGLLNVIIFSDFNLYEILKNQQAANHFASSIGPIGLNPNIHYAMLHFPVSEIAAIRHPLDELVLCGTEHSFSAT